MSFKGQTVWVRLDESGRPAVDAEGRAEMKYRENDTKTYRPSPKNLFPVDSGVSPGAAPHPSPLPSRTRGEGIGASPHPAQLGEAAERSLTGEGKQLPRPKRSRKAEGEWAMEKFAPGETIHVWTDGACSGNPGPMGIGIVVLAGDKRKEHGEYLGKGTNNIAELTAIQRGLEIAGELMPGQGHPVRVYTDSSYSIGLLTQGWKAKANQALVAELRRIIASYRNLRMVKVEGHAGVPENERCDLLARQAVAQNRHL
jgi:ribonuclease HI